MCRIGCHLLLFLVASLLFTGCSQVELEAQRKLLKQKETELKSLTDELQLLNTRLANQEAEFATLKAKHSAATTELSESRQQIETLNRALAEHIARSEQAVKLLTGVEFEALTRPVSAGNPQPHSEPDILTTGATATPIQPLVSQPEANLAKPSSFNK